MTDERITLEFITSEKPPDDLCCLWHVRLTSMFVSAEKDGTWKTTLDFVEVEHSIWWRFKQWLKKIR